MQGNVNIPDSTITTNLSFRQLVLMNMQQLTNFPYIEKDFDALTDYELLCLVVKFLNDVIANQNEQNDSITRMYQSFLALQDYVNNTKDTLENAFNNLDDYVRNYFDDLDVQEEINNKLDKMLKDGVLEQIIEQYLNSKAVFCFDTIDDLKATTNLIDGSKVRLLGNTSYNDGVNQMFLVTTRTVNDVDGENDTIVINDNLVAKRIKVKENLPLKPNITSDEEIKNLHIVNESTATATAGLSISGQENVTITHNNIEGGYWSARIGNENDSEDTTGIKLINNNLTSPHGLSLRQRTNQTTGGEHTLAFNNQNNTSSNPSIESWAKKTQILFNRIVNSSDQISGSTSGITMGAKPNQMAIGNYINHFRYGIEFGNSNLDMACNNFIENSDFGIVCSSDNSDDVIIANNIIQINASGRGIYLRSGKRVVIENCIIIYGDTLGDYNDSTSRSGSGIYSDTYDKDVTISNCTFINLAEVRITDGCKVSNCCFYNIQNVYVSGNATFSNCSFRNVNNVGITGANNKYQIFNECTFKRDTDNTTMQTYIINGRGGSNSTIAEFNSCMNINCEIDSMKPNSDMGGDKRFIAQKINGIYHTYNKAQLSDLVTALSNVGFTLKPGDKVIDNYNNKVWEVMTQGRQISYQNAIPTTGAFVKGDRIYNNFASTTTVDYWLCTATGEFGTATEPTFVAKNV